MVKIHYILGLLGLHSEAMSQQNKKEGQRQKKTQMEASWHATNIQQSHTGDSQRQTTKGKGSQKEANKMPHCTRPLDTETADGTSQPVLRS